MMLGNDICVCWRGVDLVLELLKLAGVGLVAGMFTSMVANKDHRHRKWWELRVGAYQGAIEALSDIVYYFDRHMSAEIESRELSKESKERIDAFMDAAGPKVRRLADSGAFLFSDRANAALKEFIKPVKYQSYFEDLDSSLFKAKTCLDELVACSKIDLRLRDGFLARWLN